jgi:hypothetical protein
VRLPEIIDEIKSLKNQPNHRSVNAISNYLAAFYDQFGNHIAASELDALSSKFKALSDLRPLDYKTDNFENEYNRSYGLLMFYLERIL